MGFMPRTDIDISRGNEVTEGNVNICRGMNPISNPDRKITYLYQDYTKSATLTFAYLSVCSAIFELVILLDLAIVCKKF